MNLREAKEKYFTEELWCEYASSSLIYPIEKNNINGFEILRGKDEDGSHITLKSSDISYLGEDREHALARLTAKEMHALIKASGWKMRSNDNVILVIGLGNRKITSDAQGPLSAELLDATYHLKNASPALYNAVGKYRLAILSPGTEGESGLDPSFILKITADKIKPDIIIAIDALATSCDEYIGRTIQISDAGLTPGSGVNNRKKTISTLSCEFFTLGIGIPTVISSSTLILNALEKAGIEDISPSLEEVLCNNRSFFVSPKNIDLITSSASRIISQSISELCLLLSLEEKCKHSYCI